MKTIITIIFLLCSIGVSAQIKTTQLDTAKTKYSIGSRPFIGDGYFITPPKPQYYIIASANKTMIKVSSPDSAGFVKVWINRKEIYWLSDSTFIYKAEQK